MKIEVPIRKRGHFTDEMSVGKSKKRGICIEKAQDFDFQSLALFVYPVDYLSSNQFMEDLGRIYSLRKYFSSFDD